MGIHLMQANVAPELLWRLNSLRTYISMEPPVGASTGWSVFISAFSTMLYKFQKR